MQKRHRTILFFVLAVLFLLIAPSLALYSQGYRFDWNQRKVTQTGAFFFKVSPTRVSIFIDGEPISGTDFFFGTTLTRNFLPGPYHIRLEKEGYISWERTLEIQENAVTEAKNVILFPADLKFQALQEGIEKMWPSASGSKIVFLEQTSQGALQLSLLDRSTNRKTVLTAPLSRSSEILHVLFDPQEERVLFQVAGQEQINTFIHHISASATLCGQRACSLSLAVAPKEVVFSSSPNRVLVLRNLGTIQILQETDYTTGRDLAYWGTHVAAFTVSGQNLLWLEREGTMWSVNLGPQASPQMMQTAKFPVRQETSYILSAEAGRIFLREAEKAYLIKNQEFQEIGNGVRDMRVSPDGRKLLLSNNSEIWILMLQDDDSQPRKREGDRIFITRLSEPISLPLWITSSHLIFSVGNTIKIAETDDRDRITPLEIASFVNPQIFWRDGERTLHVLSEGTLYASERLMN
ncbi:MAG: hypothetical protein Q8P39_00645 [Candidatus Yanofskybacteria bacterium]|nr:hypothetical protein [Candidatus Yanofskybacteria bacterium]